MKIKELCKLEKAFDCNMKEYKSFPFWSWNGQIEKQEILRQITEMYNAGIGGFIIHARSGIKIEYLGEKWFECVDACIERARELDMNVWIYDDNGYPSGFVGGKLLKNTEFRANFLRYSIKDHFDEKALSVFVENNSGYKRIYNSIQGVSEYHCIYKIVSPSKTDILNTDVVDEFINLTHEEYYRRYKDSFGKELVGFFTDEPQLYSYETPYSPVAKKEYMSRYNEDIDDYLIYLFNQEEKGYEFRVRYFSLLNELYVENFYKRLYDWCEAHNCKLTGHSVEETSLYTQMWGGGAVMPTYEYEHIPGIDCLEKKCWSELLPKQAGSVAQQLGKKFVVTETFGCSGFNTSPRQLKDIGEFQYFQGVNLMCQHLFPYTMAAQGKYDFPPVFSKQGNWIEGFKDFNDYFLKLGYIIANTTEHYDCLVIHPMKDIYYNYIRSQDRESVLNTEESFKNLLLLLREKGICYHFGDESIIEKYAYVDGDKITIKNCSYDTVIVPEMLSLTRSAYDLLKKFSGKLCVVKTPLFIDGVKETVKLNNNCTIDDIANASKYNFKSPDVRCSLSARKSELGEFLFIKNYDMNHSGEVFMKGIAEHFCKLNLVNMTVSNIENQMTLSGGEGVILMKSETLTEKSEEIMLKNITKNFKVSSMTDNYFVLDNGQYSKDGVNYSKIECIQKIFEQLLFENYKGKLYIKHNFTVKDKPFIKLFVEKNKYLWNKVNGHNIDFVQSDFDIEFCESDITDYICQGENEYIYCVDYFQNDNVHVALYDPLSTPSVRTCLYYDTDVEYSYLKGDFVVNKDFSIESRKKFPPITSETQKSGYPFFYGNECISGEYYYNGTGKRELILDGHYMMAKVICNGKSRNIVLETKTDITDMLCKGKNNIIIEIHAGLRNLIGPHHIFADDEPEGISMEMFTLRSYWRKHAEAFNKEYFILPFGIDNVIISEEIKK